MSILFDFERGGDDIKCPHCGTKWGIRWATEEGDPHPGEYNENCPNCLGIIVFDCCTTFTQPENINMEKQ